MPDTPEMPALTFAQLDKLARDAQIAFCLDKHSSFEVAFARAIEAARDAQWSERLAAAVKDAEAMRKALVHIEALTVSALRTKSKDLIDWEEDVAYIGMRAKDAMGSQP